MYRHRLASIAVCLALVPVLILASSSGCRKQTARTDRKTPTARERASAASQDKKKKPSRSEGKSASKAAPKEKPAARAKENKSGVDSKKRKRDADPKEAKQGNGRRKTDSAGDDKRGRSSRSREDSPPVVRQKLKGIDFTLRPDWPVFDAPNFGESYLFGYALGDRRSGRFAPRLVVKNVPGKAGKVALMIKKWAEQFASGDDGQPRPTVKIDEITVHKLSVTLVDISGAYQPDEDRPAQPKFRFLCAVIEHDDGPTVVKAVGPASAIDKHYDAIMDFIKSVKPTKKSKSAAKP